MKWFSIAALLLACHPAWADNVAQESILAQAVVPQLSYADILEAPLRTVVRVETWNGVADEGGTPVATGSGVVIAAALGHVLTNAHVVATGNHFRVQLPDGRVRNAILLGKDTATDLAVLKISPDGLEQVTSAETGELRIGDVVFAIGYPLGLDQTASIGIVSGIGRSDGSSQLTDYIQTDAAINSGNSGGALLNGRGHLVGINTAILSNAAGGNIGIGFAIPVHLALTISAQIVDFGEVRHGQIGVALGGVSEELSAEAGARGLAGARILSVEPGSPAGAAGLIPGDVVVSFNGRRIRSPQSLRTWIGVTRIGGDITLEAWRSGTRLTIVLQPVAIERPSTANLVELGAITRALVAADGAPRDLDGVFVSSVRRDSPAYQAGLRAGDIIVSINNTLVTTPQICDRLVHEAAGRVGVVVYRNGVSQRLIIEADTQ